MCYLVLMHGKTVFSSLFWSEILISLHQKASQLYTLLWDIPIYYFLFSRCTWEQDPDCHIGWTNTLNRFLISLNKGQETSKTQFLSIYNVSAKSLVVWQVISPESWRGRRETSSRLSWKLMVSLARVWMPARTLQNQMWASSGKSLLT